MPISPSVRSAPPVPTVQQVTPPGIQKIQHVVIIGFNLIQLALLEAPMIAFRTAPEQTPIGIEHAKAWARAHWRKCATWGLTGIAAALTIRALTQLI